MEHENGRFGVGRRPRGEPLRALATESRRLRRAQARTGASRPRGNLGRIVAGQAGAAESRGGPPGRLDEAVVREVGERGGADVLAHLLDAACGGDHLRRVGEVDAVEALPDHRRRRDAEVHLGCARVEQHPHDLAGRVAADDRVVHRDHALARDLRDRVVLELDPLPAQLLVGLDEGALDVAVLDQPLAEREPQRAGEADRGGRARVGDRQDEVGLDRALAREPLAHPHPRVVHLDALEPAVRAGEVEELPDAERAAVRPARAPASRAGRRRRRRRARPARPRGRTRRRRGRARTSRRRRPSPSWMRPITSGRKPCGSRKPMSRPSDSATME